MYDIGIIGSGPAGVTLARLLANRYQVLLLNNGRQKCCGGILSPKAQKTLVRFGLAPPKHVLADPQPYAVTIMDWDNQLVRSYPREYVNIDRFAFDHWLLSLVPPSIDVRHHAVYQCSEKDKDGLTLHFTENGESKTAHVRWLIGTDGAFSTVRKEFFQNVQMPKRYIAVQHWYEKNAVTVAPNCGIDPWKDYIGIFDSALTDFYIWMIPKDQRLILGGAFPLGTNASATMQSINIKLQTRGIQLGTPIYREACQLLRPLHQSSLCFGNAQIILAGEASGLISPSSAEGISNALVSARCLADSFQEQGFDPALYRRLLRYRLWSLYLKRGKIPLMYNPKLRKYVMLSGLTALRR